MHPAARIATFDQDGTLWVAHPIHTQMMYSLDRVPDVVAKKSQLRNVERFRTVLSGNTELTYPPMLEGWTVISMKRVFHFDTR